MIDCAAEREAMAEDIFGPSVVHVYEDRRATMRLHAIRRFASGYVRELFSISLVALEVRPELLAVAASRLPERDKVDVWVAVMAGGVGVRA